MRDQDIRPFQELATSDDAAPRSVADLSIIYLNINYQLKAANASNNFKHAYTLEQKKVDLLKAFYITLSQASDAFPTEAPVRYLWLRRLGLYGTLPFALALNGIGEFLSIYDLFELIPHIANPAALVASALCTVLTSFLFYTWEIELLRKALGIEHKHSHLAQILACQIQQVQISKQIQNYYTCVDNINKIENFDQVSDFIKVMSDDIAAMQQRVQKIHEPFAFKVFKWSVTLFGATMAIASGFFYAKYLLIMFSPFLVATPGGVAIIAATCLISLALFCAVRASGMMGLQKPEIQQAKSLQQELKDFKPCSDQTHTNVRNCLVSNAARLDTPNPVGFFPPKRRNSFAGFRGAVLPNTENPRRFAQFA